MSTIRTLSAAFFLATLALTAAAQTPPAAGASMPMMGGEAPANVAADLKLLLAGK